MPAVKFVVQISTKQFYGPFDTAEDARIWAEEVEAVGAWAIRPLFSAGDVVLQARLRLMRNIEEEQFGKK